MEEVIEFFHLLAHTGDWPPRWHCGKWSEFHGWLYIISDIIIWLSYFLIPVILVYFIQSIEGLKIHKVLWLFIGFILLCGATHLIDAIIFWWPIYRLSALFKFFTALVSLMTVFSLIKEIPHFIEINQKNKAKQNKTIQDQKEIIEDLKNHIKQLQGNA